MFSFGIFTTHLPYLAMVAFYAYILLFGIDQTSKGKIELSEKSAQVQIHLNDTADTIHADSSCFNWAFAEEAAIKIFEKSKVKQKWKHFGVDKIFIQDYPENSICSRPPPVLA